MVSLELIIINVSQRTYYKVVCLAFTVVDLDAGQELESADFFFADFFSELRNRVSSEYKPRRFYL